MLHELLERRCGAIWPGSMHAGYVTLSPTLLTTRCPRAPEAVPGIPKAVPSAPTDAPSPPDAQYWSSRVSNS